MPAEPTRQAGPQPVEPPLPAQASQAVRAATTVLANAGIISARTDAEILAAHAAGLDRAEFVRQALLGLATPAGFGELIARRAERIPLQHLTGTAPFCGLDLAVGPGVFVPRPETEVMAQAAIAAARSRGPAPVIVDLGTGSGALALALATALPAAQVWAVELDASAHAWAEHNLRGSGVHLVRGDARTALTHLDATVDVVVANPPYIPPGAVPREKEVRDHDPHIALYGLGPDGLTMPRGFLAAAARLLRPGGFLALEHAETQGAALREAAASFCDKVRTELDLSGRERFVTGVRL